VPRPWRHVVAARRDTVGDGVWARDADTSVKLGSVRRPHG
jgi:hypothetical protein